MVPNYRDIELQVETRVPVARVDNGCNVVLGTEALSSGLVALVRQARLVGPVQPRATGQPKLYLLAVVQWRHGADQVETLSAPLARQGRGWLHWQGGESGAFFSILINQINT